MKTQEQNAAKSEDKTEAAAAAKIAAGLKPKPAAQDKTADAATPKESAQTDFAKGSQEVDPVAMKRELDELRSKVANFEAGASQQSAKLEGKYALEQWISQNAPPLMPRDVLRKLLPETTDQAAIKAAYDKLMDGLRPLIQSHKPDFGGVGKEGGKVPSGDDANRPLPAGQKIARALNRTR